MDAIDQIGVAEGRLEARPRAIDLILNNSSVDHGQTPNPEPSNNAINRRIINLVFLQQRIQTIQNRQEDNDTYRIKVLHQIIRDPITSHLARLRDKVVTELAVDDPVNGVEAENFARNERTLHFFDKLVVPFEAGYGFAETGLVGGFRGIHFSRFDHEPDYFEGVGYHGSRGGTHDVDFFAEDEGHGADEEDT